MVTVLTAPTTYLLPLAVGDNVGPVITGTCRSISNEYGPWVFDGLPARSAICCAAMMAAGFVVPAATAVDALRVPVRLPWRTLLPAFATGVPGANPEPTSVALQLTVTLVLYQRPYTAAGDVEHVSVGAEVSTPTVTKGN